jgi:hypothetical protein
MARLVSRPDLDAQIARTVGMRAVERLKRQVEHGAKARAPAAKVWMTVKDDRVRPSHVLAHGQTIPENLRYKLQAMIYVRKGRGPGGHAINPAGGWELTPLVDLARKPRDPSLPIEQKAECRCESVIIVDGVARTIHSGPTEVAGTRARAEVYTRFPRAAESEVGTEQDKAAHFMSGAVREARARLHAR